MPGSYRIDVERGIVFTRGWGVLTDVQTAAHAKALAADPRHNPAFRQLADFRDLTEIRVTSDGIRDVARSNPFKRDARRAFVVATDEAFGLTRMFGFFADASNEQFMIFRAIEPAMEWLGLDPKTPWPEGPPDAQFGAD
jgi:hypothetical protein